jgi:hypothetical protein
MAAHSRGSVKVLVQAENSLADLANSAKQLAFCLVAYGWRGMTSWLLTPGHQPLTEDIEAGA